jgi:excinuclease UvrABC helicase subunit UvrB
MHIVCGLQVVARPDRNDSIVVMCYQDTTTPRLRPAPEETTARHSLQRGFEGSSHRSRSLLLREFTGLKRSQPS